MKKITRLFSFCLLIFTIFSLTKFVNAQEKLKTEDIIGNHLKSIGTQENRAAVKNIVAAGAAQFSILRSSNSSTNASTAGKAVILSEKSKIFFGINFDSFNYPVEKISFDGSNVNIAFISPGIRSALGNFILSNKKIFSEGLFGGSLSASWSLIDLQNRKAKISSGGRKKLNGRNVYVLDYSPDGGSASNIKLYFDAENFQHLRTEYKQIFSAAQGNTPEQSSRQLEARQQFVEEFSNYGNESGLMLPHSYRLFLSLNGQSGTNEFEWKFEFTRFLFNQNLDPKSFNISVE